MLEKDRIEEGDETFEFMQEQIQPIPFYKKIKVQKVLAWLLQIVCSVILVVGIFWIKGKWFEDKTIREEISKEVVEDKPQIIRETTYQTIDMTPVQMDEFAKEIQSLQDNVKQYIVEIKQVDKEEDWSTNPDKYKLSAGFWVDQSAEQGWILVAGDFEQDRAYVLGQLFDETICPLEVVSYDKELDMTLLSLDKTKLSQESQAFLANLEEPSILYPSLGSSVYAVGNPLGYPDTFTQGIISGRLGMTDTWDDRYQLLTLQMPISDHGSGLVMNVQGEILGLIVPGAHQSKIAGLTNILTMRQIKEITQGLKGSKNLPYLGIQVRGMEVSEQLENEMPIGLYVEKVAENSPALSVGLQPADIIVSMNGEINLTQESFNQLLLRDSEVNTWTIIVQRLTPKGYSEMSFEVNLHPSKENLEN